MASTQSKIFTLLLKLINKKSFLRKQLATNRFNVYSCPEPPSFITQKYHVNKFLLNGRNVFTLSPKNKISEKHILYLHGGAYVQCFNIFHWRFLAALMKSTGCTITAPDYPLAPRYTYKDSFIMVTALYKQLTAQFAPGNLTLMGDSAGGGFAFALAQEIKRENGPQPQSIVLLSPWLDITLSNPEINRLSQIDPFLDKESLRQAGNLYAGELATDHYLLSPINGSLEGLGKISLFVGSNELIVADARKLKILAEARGLSLNYFEYADMVHAWMFLNLPESKKARQQIANLIAE